MIAAFWSCCNKTMKMIIIKVIIRTLAEAFIMLDKLSDGILILLHPKI
jgi:hypothetical protein